MRSRRTIAKSKTGSMPEETPASRLVVPVGAWVSSTALRMPLRAIFSWIAPGSSRMNWPCRYWSRSKKENGPFSAAISADMS